MGLFPTCVGVNRIRTVYKNMADQYNIEWHGRNYDPKHWNHGDPVNRALSVANAALYGICHAAILSAGFSPAMGFIHSGKMLSFVYDIADLYKTEITIPIAFEIGAQNPPKLERFVRLACRDKFHDMKIMKRIIPNIMEVLGVDSDFGESSEDLEGKIITLADRTTPGDLSGSS